jgi:NAD-dependent dihydropyrimidine dehydrogenase PreA subunit
VTHSEIQAENLIFPPSKLEVVNFLPIDPDFQTKMKVSGEHNGHKTWGAEGGKLGIHGTNVAVDWDICVGDGVCISVCPVSLYDWSQTPSGDKRTDPVRQADCIQCLACETQCPTQAIKITPPP